MSCSEKLGAIVKNGTCFMLEPSKAGLEPWTTCRDSSTSRGKRRGSLSLLALSDIFFPPSVGLHYTLPGVFQRSPKLSRMQQANSTNKPGESCSTSTLVASTRVVSYMEKYAS